ncbi:TRAPP II complex [Cytidiella melzeri]|nr:TRAPP II complex [Cytidiella melzeri]
MPTIQAQFSEVLNDTVPEGSVFPLAKNCFVFEEGDSGASLGTHQGLVVIPGMMGNKKLYVGTLLADLCSSILAEFASVVQALETPLGNEYLNAALFPVLPPASDMPQPLENDPPMRSSLPPLPHQHSQPELATPASLLRSKTPTPLLMKRNSSVGPGPASPYRHSSLPVQSSKKKPATIGAVSSHGRLFKVLGDFFLLAGRTMDASVWYTEAIAMLKASQDNVWHASALEGLAIVPVLDAWSAEKPDVVDEEKQPWCDIADKLSQATSLYYRAAPQSDTDSSYSFVSWFYARAVLRHTYILYACWSAKGWGPLAFSTLLLAVPPPTLLEDTVTDAKKMKRMSYGAFQRLTTATGISRSMIADILSQSHGPWLLHLGTRERITILEHVAAMYGILGYQRKEAYVLREVLGCVMDLIVCGREETGGSRIAGTGLGIQGVDVGNGSQGSVGIRTNDNTIGNDSVLRVVKHICKVHGIDLEAVKLESHPDHSSQPLPTHDTAVDTNLFQDTFGWPELQIGIVREAIAVAEALPDYPSVAQFSLSALRTLHLVMSQGDQHHLYNTALKALSTAKRRGDSRCVEYWSGQPLVSIEIVPLPLVRLPLEKPISLLAEAVDSVPPVLVGKTDPFLYNPRRMAAGQSSTLLVQKEAFDVVITLRNPFVFDLELASLSLSTTGVAIEAKPLTLVVPANSFHPVTITAQSLEPGLLCIRGCIVQAPGGAIREFLLPLATSEEDTRHERTRSAIACESGRSKYSGLEARLWEKPDKRSSVSAQKMDTQFLQCKIVAEQPLLRIRRTSLTHGAVMLYNGERSSIRITLENVSLLPVDFIHLTFDDSTVAPAQQALTEGESSVFETYETEYDLIHRPMFTWDNKASRQDVSPGEKVVLTVSCSGKVGCTNGTIHISYAYCHRPRSNLEKPPEVFHTRQLSYPVLVTVYHMLECYGLDILPYTPDMIDYAAVTDENATKRMEKPLQVRDPEDWCIFSIEVRNTYGIPFEVSFEVDENDAPGESTMTLVPPGSTKRVILPLRRFRLPEEQIAHPIPTLSDRQFVVSKAHLSPKEESMQRELFWYREELLKRVRGRWKENGGSRFGDLSLRQQRLALPMLSVLQVEDIRVHLCIRTYGHDREPGVINCTAGSYFPPVDEFVYLHTKVTNMSCE